MWFSSLGVGIAINVFVGNSFCILQKGNQSMLLSRIYFYLTTNALAAGVYPKKCREVDLKTPFLFI